MSAGRQCVLASSNLPFIPQKQPRPLTHIAAAISPWPRHLARHVTQVKPSRPIVQLLLTHVMLTCKPLLCIGMMPNSLHTMWALRLKLPSAQAHAPASWPTQQAGRQAQRGVADKALPDACVGGGRLGSHVCRSAVHGGYVERAFSFIVRRVSPRGGRAQGLACKGHTRSWRRRHTHWQVSLPRPLHLASSLWPVSLPILMAWPSRRHLESRRKHRCSTAISHLPGVPQQQPT